MKYERLREISIGVWSSAVVWTVADPRGHLGRFLHPDPHRLSSPYTWFHFQDCHYLVIGETAKKSINLCFKSLSTLFISDLKCLSVKSPICIWHKVHCDRV